MDEHQESDALEFLTVDSSAEPVESTVTRRGVDLRVVVVLLGALVAAAFLFRPTASDDGAAEESVPTTEPSLDDPGLAGLDQVGEATTGSSGADELSQLSGLGLRAIVTSSSDRSSVVLWVSDDGDEIVIDEVPALSRFAFDASGQWLAGTSTTENGARRQVLWAGRVGGDFEPVAIGVRSFAWHDSQPATLAWSDDDEPTITTVALADLGPDRAFDAPISGRVAGWGDWGFAISYWNEGSATALLGPSGELIATGLPGRFNGHLPGSGLVLSGARNSEPLLVDAATGDTSGPPWLDADDYVWSLAAAGDDPTAAALVGRDGLRADPFAAEVTTVGTTADASGDLLVATEAFTDLTLTADGEWIVLAQQQSVDGDDPGEILAISRSGDTILRLAVPDLFPGREWVSALAVG